MPVLAQAQPAKSEDQLRAECGGLSSLFNLERTACYAGFNTSADAVKNPVIAIANIIRIILGIISVLFLLMIVYGGVTWMIAGGSEEKIKEAKGLISGAIIGMIVIFLAWAISAFIFDQLLKATTNAPVSS